MYGHDSYVEYLTRDGKPKLRFVNRNGVTQGKPLSGPLLDLAMAAVLKQLRLDHPSYIILSDHDDVYVIGLWQDVLTAYLAIVPAFAGVGLTLQPTKSSLLTLPLGHGGSRVRTGV